MLTFALLSFALGGLLGQRFPVFILWPVLAAGAALIVCLGAASAAPWTLGVAAFVCLAVNLQLGYLAGVLTGAWLDANRRGHPKSARL